MLLVKNLIATRICLACAYTQASLCKIQADGSLPESLQEELAEDGAAFAAAVTNKLIDQIKDAIQVRHTLTSGCVSVCLVPEKWLLQVSHLRKVGSCLSILLHLSCTCIHQRKLMRQYFVNFSAPSLAINKLLPAIRSYNCSNNLNSSVSSTKSLSTVTHWHVHLQSLLWAQSKITLEYCLGVNTSGLD